MDMSLYSRGPGTRAENVLSGAGMSKKYCFSPGFFSEIGRIWELLRLAGVVGWRGHFGWRGQGKSVVS